MPKPFHPFGTTPGIGSSFYIGSAEIFQKKLTKLRLNFEWKDVPGNLKNYYNNLTGFKITDALIEKLKDFSNVQEKVEPQKLTRTLQIKDNSGATSVEAKLPLEVLKNLESLKDQEIEDQEKFIGLLQKTIVENYIADYEFVILENAKTLTNSSFQAQYSILFNANWYELGLRQMFNSW